MSLPGFTAEASAYKSTLAFINHGSQHVSIAGIIPVWLPVILVDGIEFDPFGSSWFGGGGGGGGSEYGGSMRPFEADPDCLNECLQSCSHHDPNRPSVPIDQQDRACRLHCAYRCLEVPV